MVGGGGNTTGTGGSGAIGSIGDRGGGGGGRVGNMHFMRYSVMTMVSTLERAVAARDVLTVVKVRERIDTEE